MIRFAFVILFLSLGHGNVGATDATTAPTAAPTATSTTAAPTPAVTTTAAPTTAAPTTAAPTTAAPTTAAPTTAAPTTAAPTTAAPTTVAPTTTLPPTTVAPTTVAPTTVAPTTAAPTTAAPTTAAPTTAAPNATTVAPNATTVAPPTTTPPPTPVPTLPTPATGKYTLKNGNDTCLKADFGLRLVYKLGGKEQQLNLNPNPNVTSATGNCGVNSSLLILKSESDTVAMNFTFTNADNKFSLHALSLSILTTGGNFSAVNSSLSLWQAGVGSSYMCNKEQSYNITTDFTLHVDELRVQPFAVKKNEFSTAHECTMDDINILIPIIVGAALAGLILIVVIAYVIGRRKTYVGYQTL